MCQRTLSAYCKHVLGIVYYERVRAGKCVNVSESEQDERGWLDFEPWGDSRLDMYVEPSGRRWLANVDEPATAVDVTDVPLQYASEVRT